MVGFVGGATPTHPMKGKLKWDAKGELEKNCVWTTSTTYSPPYGFGYLLVRSPYIPQFYPLQGDYTQILQMHTHTHSAGMQDSPGTAAALLSSPILNSCPA